MKKSIIIGSVLAAALAFHVVVNPLRAASSLRDAVAEENGPGIIDHIDFDALRANVKAGLDASAAESKDPGAFFAASVVWAIVDPVLHPSEIRKIGSPMAGPSAMQYLDMEEAETGYGFGVTRFTVFVNQPGQPPIGVVFAPRGLGWKVVSLDLSELL